MRVHVDEELARTWLVAAREGVRSVLTDPLVWVIDEWCEQRDARRGGGHHRVQCGAENIEREIAPSQRRHEEGGGLGFVCSSRARDGVEPEGREPLCARCNEQQLSMLLGRPGPAGRVNDLGGNGGPVADAIGLFVDRSWIGEQCGHRSHIELVTCERRLESKPSQQGVLMAHQGAKLRG